MAGKPGCLKGVALIGGGANSTVAGALHFVQDPSTGYTEVRGRLTGLAPGLHGFHIHAFGDTTNGCNSTGPHFNPYNKSHGAPVDDERHVGDLGNIQANKDGIAEVFIKDLQISLRGPHSILGRAVVVHSDSDDLGKDGEAAPEDSDDFAKRVGLGTQMIKDINEKLQGEESEYDDSEQMHEEGLEECESKWQKEDEEKNKKFVKGGQKMAGKMKTGIMGADEPRRKSGRVDTEHHTLERAENLLKQKNLENTTDPRTSRFATQSSKGTTAGGS